MRMLYVRAMKCMSVALKRDLSLVSNEVEVLIYSDVGACFAMVAGKPPKVCMYGMQLHVRTSVRCETSHAATRRHWVRVLRLWESIQGRELLTQPNNSHVHPFVCLFVCVFVVPRSCSLLCPLRLYIQRTPSPW